MILEERSLPLSDVGNVFKIIAEELSANVNTQIIINDDILKEIKRNNCDYHVYFHNYLDDFEVSEWYTLHEKHAFSPEISKLGIKLFGHNYSQLTRFSFRGYNFSKSPCKSDTEFTYFGGHDIQRILVIEIS